MEYEYGTKEYHKEQETKQSTEKAILINALENLLCKETKNDYLITETIKKLGSAISNIEYHRNEFIKKMSEGK